jgi:hypothetical protein
MSATHAMLAAGAAVGGGAREAIVNNRPVNGGVCSSSSSNAPCVAPLRRGARAWGARPRARASRAFIAAASSNGSDDA